MLKIPDKEKNKVRKRVSKIKNENLYEFVSSSEYEEIQEQKFIDENFNLKSNNLELNYRAEQIRLLTETIDMRKQYAEYCVWILISSLVIVLTIIVLSGCGCLSLDKSVLITLITGVVIETVSCFYVIINSLFPENIVEKIKKAN